MVDADLLVSAFISPFSHPKEIEGCWRKGEFILVTSREIVEEVNRVLHLRDVIYYGIVQYSVA